MLIRQLFLIVYRNVRQVLFVCNHGEDQPGHVGGDQQSCYNQTEYIGILFCDGMGVEEHGGYKEGDDSHDHQGAIQTGQRDIEVLNFEFHAAGKNTEAQHQQQVADDGAGEAGLDHIEQAFLHQEKGDDQLGRIPEGGIKKAPQPLPGIVGYTFCSPAQKTGYKNDRNGREHELQGVVPVCVMSDGAKDKGYYQQRRRDPFFQVMHTPVSICRLIS
ncbi:hypothetical protein D3C75_885800 [compost metagenome]